MALVGLPTVAALTTIEMTPEQYKQFRRSWILSRAEDLVRKGGVTKKIAVLTAKNDFALEEQKEEPFEAGNQATRRNRRIRARRREAAEKRRK
jgi:hypothetical protein